MSQENLREESAGKPDATSRTGEEKVVAFPGERGKRAEPPPPSPDMSDDDPDPGPSAA